MLVGNRNLKIDLFHNTDLKYNKIKMEILRMYGLPTNFKPVAKLCSQLENNLFIEYKCFESLSNKNYYNIVMNLSNDTEIEDDVEFIVNLQNEFDIANETAQEKAEWYYTLASCRTIETLAEIKLKYNQYINTIAHFESNLYTKIVKIKDYILNYYYHLVFPTSVEEINMIIKKLSINEFENIEKDLHWID